MLIFISSGLEIFGVVLATVAFMIIGMFWYSPMLFGKKWMEAVGMTQEMASAAKKNTTASYVYMTISALVMTYILALFIKNLFIPSLFQAAMVGVLAWIGFIATSGSSEHLFNAKPKPWMLYYINTGYYLISLIISSAILFIFIK